MEIRANYIVVGLFSLVAILGVLFTVLWLSKANGSEFDFYEISFPDGVHGLSVGSPIFFSGIRVGQVDQIKISDEVPGAVLVKIAVATDTPVRGNSEARLDILGLTGGSAISITGGTVSSPLMNITSGKVGKIKSVPSSLARVMDAVPNTLVLANRVLDNLNRMTSEENEEALANTLKSVATLSTSFAQHTDSIDRLFQNAEKNMEELNIILQRINATAKSFESSISSLSPEIQRIAREGLPQVRILLTEARDLIRVVNRIAQKIDSNPSRFFFGDQVKQVRIR